MLRTSFKTDLLSLLIRYSGLLVTVVKRTLGIADIVSN